MKKPEGFIWKLLFLPLWLIIILVIMSAVGLVFVFVSGLEAHPISYLIYALSFYTLSVTVLFCITDLPGYIRGAKELILSFDFGRRFINDSDFRFRVSLYLSLGINLAYAIFNCVLGALYVTNWFYLLASFYAIVGVMRFLLVSYFRHNELGCDIPREWRRVRVCGVILAFVNLLLSAVVLMMVFFDRGFVYRDIFIYVMALFTFYSATSAIIGVIRNRKGNSPVMTFAQYISLVTALVSMLTLEGAMLGTFGTDMPKDTQKLFVILTGAGIAVAVFALSIYTVVHSTLELKRLAKVGDKTEDDNKLNP